MSAEAEDTRWHAEPLRSSKHALRAERLRKTFKKSGFVLQDVRLVVFPGEIVGLLGPTGAGKTTTLQIILGRLRTEAGVVWLNGLDVTHFGLRLRMRRGLDFAPKPRLGLPPLGLNFLRPPSLRQCVLRALKPDGSSSRERRASARALLDEFGLRHLRRRPVAALSAAERVRAELAVAVASQPSFIVLDDPFAGVDPLAVTDVHAVVRHVAARGPGLLISADNVREVLALTTRSYLMHHGRILAHGRPDQLTR